MSLIKKVINNADLTEKERKDIIFLKNQHWEHPYESQINWMAKNHLQEDKHVLFLEDDEPIAYLYVATVPVEIEQTSQTMLGIGNVCVAKKWKGTGVGRELVCFANELISEKNSKGILLCHDKLVGFYQKCSWKEIEVEEAFLLGEKYFHKIMLLNAETLQYSTVKIERNF